MTPDKINRTIAEWHGAPDQPMLNRILDMIRLWQLEDK